MVNDRRLDGAIACIPGLVLEWNVGGMGDVHLDSLGLFVDLNPALDILVLGCGAKIEFVPPPLREFLKERGIALEALDTRNACSTYNFLSSEGRLVGAALIPPR